MIKRRTYGVIQKPEILSKELDDIIKQTNKSNDTLDERVTLLETTIMNNNSGFPGTTGIMTVSMDADIKIITPTGDCTFNASGGRIGRIITFHIITSGVTSFTLTFGSNFRTTGTLATGTTSARFFSISFRCIDGITWTEIARTAVQT